MLQTASSLDAQKSYVQCLQRASVPANLIPPNATAESQNIPNTADPPPHLTLVS